MAEKTGPGSKKRKPGVDEAPDKCQYVLTKQLDACGKCNKQCIEDEKAIQCDLCCMWGHADREGITKEQYNAIETLSTV